MRPLRWGRRTFALLVVAVLALASGIAVAASENQGPRTDRTNAEFALQLVSQNAKQCEGQDGQYTEQVHARYEGTSVGDPRLSGQLTVTEDSLVRNTPKPGDPGTLGTTDGHFTVRDDNGRVKATGDFYATVEGPAPGAPTRIVGTAVGTVNTMDRQETGGRLVGSFRASASPGGQELLGSFGGAGEASLPAVIQHGSCRGPAEQAP